MLNSNLPIALYYQLKEKIHERISKWRMEDWRKASE